MRWRVAGEGGLFDSMQLHRCRFKLAFAQQGDHIQASGDGFIDQRLFFLARSMQYEIDHRLLQVQRARMADAYAQAPVILRAERRRDVFQAVVPAR